jgi:phospholipid transport system substrate-binding protein
MSIFENGNFRWLRAGALAALLAAPCIGVADSSQPAQIVEATAGRLLEQIDARRAEFEKNPDQLRNLVRDELLPMMDQDYSARLILGRQGRNLPAEQISEFAEALGTVLTDRYSSGLLRFRSRDQLEILPPNSKDSERLTRVRTRVQLESGGSAPVDYAFRKTSEGWKVFDVTVEGISYVITFRNQLGPKVAAEGIEKVTADLLSGRIDVKDS